MARAMSLMGAALPRDLIPPGMGNALGHWESEPISLLNDYMLATSGGDRWDDSDLFQVGSIDGRKLDVYRATARALLRAQFGQRDLIVLKDPRISLLTDFWEDTLQSEGFDVSWIVMARWPDDVAASLFKRDGIPLERARRLWVRYMAHADIGTTGRRRVFCRYDDLVDNSGATLARVLATLQLPTPPDERMQSAIASVDSRQRHHRVRGGVSSPSCDTRVTELWSYLADLARDAPVVPAVSAGAWVRAHNLIYAEPGSRLFRKWWKMRAMGLYMVRLVTGRQPERYLFTKRVGRPLSYVNGRPPRRDEASAGGGMFRLSR